MMDIEDIRKQQIGDLSRALFETQSELSNVRNAMEGISWPHHEAIRILKDAGANFSGAHGESIVYAVSNIIAELTSLRQYKAEAESQPAVARVITSGNEGVNIALEQHDARGLQLMKHGDAVYARPVPAGSCAVPEGWRMVPNKPTNEMFAAAHSVNIRYGSDGMDIPYFTRLNSREAQNIWSAMLSAIPSNSEGEK